MTDELPALPALNPDIVDDDESLAAAVDEIILLDPVAQRRAAEINDHAAWLRAAVDPDTWSLALEIEARATERWSDVALVLVRHAFAAGRRFPLPPGQS